MRTAQRKSHLEQNIDLKRQAQKQRKQEYNKSMAKHTEYPSVPEYQNKFRDRHEKELAGLEETYKVAAVEFAKATEQLAAKLAQAMPLEIGALVQRHMQGQAQKPTNVDEARIKALESSLEARISSLDSLIKSKTALLDNEVRQAQDSHRELKASLVQERSDFENRLAADFDKKMTAQQKIIDGLLESHKRLEDQISKIQNDRTTTAAQPDQDRQQEQNGALLADVSKIRLENGRLRDDIEYLRANAARRSELGDLKTDCSDVKVENARLGTILSQVRDDNKALTTRFGEYAEMTRQHQVTVSRLDTTSGDHQRELSRLDVVTRRHDDKLSQLDQLTRDHQDELSRLDLNMLEQVAEGWGLEWPNVLNALKTFDGVRVRLDRLEKDLPDVVRYKDRLELLEGDAYASAQTAAEVKDRAVRLTAQSGEAVSRQSSVGSKSDKEDPAVQKLMLRVWTIEDKLRKSEEKLSQADAFENSALFKISQVQDNVTRRVKTIETRLDGFKVDSFLGDMQELRAEFHGMGEKLNYFKTQVKQLEARFEDFSRRELATSLLQSDPEVSKFKTKVEKFEGDFEKLSTEVHDVSANFEFLNHQVTDLDSRYNNITTKTLAEHILAQMELVYPTNREIIANMQELQRRMTCIEKETRKTEEESRKTRATVEELRHQANISLSEKLLGAGSKRRRVDERANGTRSPRLSANGTDRSPGSPAHTPTSRS